MISQRTSSTGGGNGGQNLPPKIDDMTGSTNQSTQRQKHNSRKRALDGNPAEGQWPQGQEDHQQALKEVQGPSPEVGKITSNFWKPKPQAGKRPEIRPTT